ncbi:MAG TPA: fibronectin type III domain-containing protein [Blastocatellia bacterium]|nr:fibronectin type III domain-containing protein [Blastocatellia bacterium]
MNTRRESLFRQKNAGGSNMPRSQVRLPAWVKWTPFLCALVVACWAWTPPARGADAILVPAGATWKYLDNGSDQGTAWRGVSFNDSAWASGPAQLGYGDGDEATVVGYGPDPTNKYITTYFRHAFNVADASGFQSVTLRLLRDDGAVVYLNGTEVFRSNMPAGTIGYRTLASAAIGSAEETTFFQTAVNPALLVNGANVLAVEVHQANATSSDISFQLELVGSTSTPVPAVTRGPYLQSGTPTSVVVRWRTDVATDSRVRYGTTQGNLTLTADNPTITTEHEVTLTGLSPETTYYYSVGTAAATLAGNDAGHFFMTAPAAGAARPTRIWVLGDSGTANANAQAVRNAYLSFTGATHTNLWLMLGDNAYPNGTDSEYQAAVFNMYPTMLRKSVLWPTLGNHDTAGSTNPPSSLPYYNIFTLPTNGEAGGMASGTEDYYSFDYGNIHFICLDSMTSDRSPGGPMLTWLQNDLASTTQQWIIAFWHHPPYSKGSHNSDTETQLVQMRENALPILEAGGVDLVLTGHSHSYERSFLIDGHYGLSGTFTDAMKKDGGDGRADGAGAYTKASPGAAPNEGAVYVVAGSSGQTSGGLLNHPAMFISLNNLGSMVLDINGNRLDARFLRETGSTADYFTIIKGVAPPAPPAAPTGLTAAAAASSQINLAWADNASNEDGFKVERSTDGTNFTQIATVGANATGFANTGLSANTTYYYRVRAYNAAGNSAYSDIASATTPQPPPVAPTGLTAAAVSSSRINLTWADNSNNESGFKIERCAGSSCTNFAQIAQVGAGVRSFSDTGLRRNTTYRYRVRAYNTGGNSAYSNIASARTLKR